MGDHRDYAGNESGKDTRRVIGNVVGAVDGGPSGVEDLQGPAESGCGAVVRASNGKD